MKELLLIEDDADCERFIREAVEPLVDKITATPKLADGFEYIAAHPGLDAVWLDLALEDSSVDQTIAAIPRLRTLMGNAALIVVSGYGDSYRHRAMEAGADAYSGKTELCGFNRNCIGALFITAAVKAMARGVAANSILERVTQFFQTISTRPDQSATN